MDTVLPGGVQRRWAASSGHRTRLGDATRRTATAAPSAVVDVYLFIVYLFVYCLFCFVCLPAVVDARTSRWSCRRSCLRAGGCQ